MMHLAETRRIWNRIEGCLGLAVSEPLRTWHSGNFGIAGMGSLSNCYMWWMGINNVLEKNTGRICILRDRSMAIIIIIRRLRD